MKELLNVKHCEYILSLSKADIKEMIFDSAEYNDDGGKYSWNNYYKSICRYLSLVCSNNGVMKMGYSHASGKSSGRRYSSVFGIQNLQAKIRGFVVDSKYIDYDMKCCHGNLLLYLCNKHNIIHV